MPFENEIIYSLQVAETLYTHLQEKPSLILRLLNPLPGPQTLVSAKRYPTMSLCR